MKTRSTIVMAIVAAALVIYFIAIEVRRPTSAERVEQSFLVFGGADFAAGGLADRKTLSQLASGLSLERDGDRIVLEKQHDVWRVTEPVAVDADTGEVSRILFELETLRREQSIPTSTSAHTDTAEYGLDKPAIKLTLSIRKPGDEARQYTLLIGRRTPARKMVYVRRTGSDSVDVVSDGILDVLNRTVNDLRTKVVLPLDPSAVDHVTLAYSDGRRIALQRHDGQWRLTTPAADIAESTTVDNLLARLAGLRLSADDFVGDDIAAPADTGLNKPLLRLTLKSGSVATGLLIGTPAPGAGAGAGAGAGNPERVYAQRLGQHTVFLLKKTDVAELTCKAADLRAGRALYFRQRDINRVVIETPNGKAVLARKEHTWRIETPRPNNADDASVEAFLGQLAALDIIAWEDAEGLDACGLSLPLAKIRLSTRRTEHILHVGRLRRDTSTVYARRGDFGPVLVVGTRFLRHVMRAHLDFLPRETLTFNKDSLRSMLITRPNGTIALRREKAGWFLAKPVRIPADRVEVSDLQWALSSIKAADFLGGKTHDLSALGLDPAHMSVRLKYADPSAQDGASVVKTLRIGRIKKKSGGQRYAMLADGGEVFLIEKALPRLLLQDFVSRDVCRFNPLKALSLTLEYPDRRVSFDRNGQQWFMTEPEQRLAPRKAITNLLEAASQLRAKATLGYAVDDPARYGLDRPALVLTVRLDGPGDDTRRITIGKLREDLYFATSSSLPLPCAMAARDVAPLMIERPKDDKNSTDKTGETTP